MTFPSGKSEMVSWDVHRMELAAHDAALFVRSCHVTGPAKRRHARPGVHYGGAAEPRYDIE